MPRYLELAEEAMREIRARRPMAQMTDGTSEKGALLASVRRWLVSECVISSRCASNPRILHREFCRWSGRDCTTESLLEAFQNFGLGLDDSGMVAGIALGADFVASCNYERERLRM